MRTVCISVDLDGDYGSDSLRGIDEQVPGLLDEFARRGVIATFFVVGEIARARAALLRSVAQHGHAIGSHGMTHTPFSRLDPAAQRRELRESKLTIEDALGRACVGFRAPYFDVPFGLGRALEDTGYRWSSSTAPLSPIAGWRRGWRDDPHRLEATAVVERPVSALLGLPVPDGLSYRRLLWPLSAMPAAPPRVFYFHPYELLDEVPAYALPGWMRPLLVVRRGSWARTHLWRWVDEWRANDARFVTLDTAIC